MKRLFFSLLILSSLLSTAGVNYRSGNFYMSYTDIEFPGSKTEITRSYNSLTTSVGLFGYGWGTYMETQLFALPDGNLSVRWWGGGNEDIFEAVNINQQGLYYMINEIIKNEIKKGRLENVPVDILKRKAVLASDASLRIAKYIDLINNKILAPWTQTSTTKKTWKRNVNQVIQWDGEKYTFQNWDDKYFFIGSGLLSEIIEKNTQIKLFYTNNLLSAILVDDKFRCTINTDSSGKITKLSFTDSTQTKEAFFTYDSDNNLLYSKDAGNNEYWFHYDKIHNLNRIGYTDSTSMEMTYDPVTNRVIKVKERNGAAITYQYPFFYTEDGKINYRHYATRIKKYDSTGANMFNEYYEYESRLQPDGDDYLYRRLIQTDTSYDESIYPPVVGNAVYRKTNLGEAWASYDGKNRCVYLKIKDSIYFASYNILDKPNKFLQIDSMGIDTIQYKYLYNNRNGELIQCIKNKKIYKINGTKKSGQIEVIKGNISLLIKFKNSIAYSIENKQWGIFILPVEPTKKEEEDSVIQTEESSLKEEPIENNVLSEENNRMMTEKMEERKAQIIEARNRARHQETQKTKEDKTRKELMQKEIKIRKLLELYFECKDIIEAKTIPHEWIWEKI